MIIIPMAGESKRFFDAGYNVDKFKLNLGNSTLFNLSISSFQKYFKSEYFVFIIKDIVENIKFIEDAIAKLGIENFDIVRLNKKTKGQADTVYKGIKYLNLSSEVYIFNIDTIRIDFKKPNKIIDNKNYAGYLEVFRGNGDHWFFY